MNDPLRRPTDTPAPDLRAGEPLYFATAIQPHGVLVAVAEPSLDIEQASSNLAAFFGIEPRAALGRSLADLLPTDSVAAVRAALADCPADGPSFRCHMLPRRESHGPLALTAHRRAGRAILEFERAAAGPAPEDLAKVAAAFRIELDSLSNPYEIARRTAEAMAEVTRHDRVLIYRFLPDWSGEIVAEVRRPATAALLGLRFTAAEIPDRARRLCLANPLRMIVDVDGAPVPIQPPVHPITGLPLDLGHAGLRAASTGHLASLRNRGVAGALVASLVVQGRLWGLVTCHHDRPRQISPAERASVVEFAAIAAAALTRAEAHCADQAEQRIARYLGAIARTTPGTGNLVQRLICGEPNLLELADADGIAIRTGAAMVCIGQTPDPEILERLAAHVAPLEDHILVTDHLAALEPAAESCRQVAAGMMAVGLPYQPGVVLAAFRRELVQDVVWGGDPARPAELDGNLLTPRKSFLQWRETVTGRSRPWEPEALAAWRALPRWLSDTFGTFTMAGERLNADLIGLRLPVRLDDPVLRGLLDVMPGAVLMAAGRDDPIPRVIAANRGFRRSFGLLSDDLAGSSLPELAARLGLDAAALERLGPGAAMEMKVLSPDVGERIVSVGRQPFLHHRTPRAELQVSAWVFDDVTGLRRAEQALKSARDQALVASRAKTEFLAAMSHELRTPLNAIIGFSEIMRAELFGSLGSPRYREYIQHIETSGEHLLKVIGDVLDISKVEAGKYVLEEQAIDLGALVEAVCLGETPQAERAGIKLMQDLAAMPLVLQGDERAIRQILLTLLINAFKLTPSGGMVTCRTLLLPDGAIAIEVQDTGVGIPDELLQRVLDPGANGGRPAAPRRDGGLGLSVVRVLVELHNARSTVTAQSGRGTTLRITFPSWRTVTGPARY